MLSEVGFPFNIRYYFIDSIEECLPLQRVFATLQQEMSFIFYLI